MIEIYQSASNHETLAQEIPVLGVGFILKALGSLIYKYPLVIPYILEKKLLCPNLGMLKVDNF